MGWKPETFEVAHPSGPVPKAGYTYRGLGLFLERAPYSSPKGRRKTPGSWSLTHLGTGHKIVSIEGDVASAFPVATEIAEAGDWEFLSLQGWKDRFPDAGARVKEIMARHRNIKSSGSNPLSPARSHEIAQQIASNRP